MQNKAKTNKPLQIIIEHLEYMENKENKTAFSDL